MSPLVDCTSLTSLKIKINRTEELNEKIWTFFNLLNKANEQFDLFVQQFETAGRLLLTQTLSCLTSPY